MPTAQYLRAWYKKHPGKATQYHAQYREKNPWIKALRRIKERCNNITSKTWRWYGGKGIKNLLNTGTIKRLWIRDNAKKMIHPSIDRLDTNKDYCESNCRFIEWEKNRRKL